MPILWYYAEAQGEGAISRLAEEALGWSLETEYVDFDHEPRWVQRVYSQCPDFAENWVKYNLCTFGHILADAHGGAVPERYKGVVMNLDDSCDPLWLAFGKYGDRWLCEHFTRTFNADGGFSAHASAIVLLKQAERYLEHIEVVDETGYWDTGNREASLAAYRQGIGRLGLLSRAIAKEEFERGAAAPGFDPTAGQFLEA